MKIEVGDLVTIPVLKDSGIVMRIVQQYINDYDLENFRSDYDLLDNVTLLAEVYWQKMGRSRLEMVSDLKKIN
jgi:hypothetical protein